ncbi:peptide transporter MTD1 [Mycena maculata]|uniref:Peptide transporter MTD1 n=1 Tax=Mycena maculata TaxID=230809 RepID=A0AAD7N2S3_9AGAR|nr:peptide transporter MTD1 [Mycena maculata]
MSLRSAFRRQDSSFALPALNHAKHAQGMTTALEDEKEKLSGKDLEDPAALSAEDLDEKHRGADGRERAFETAEDIASRLISMHDVPSMPVNTARMYILGLGFTCFSAILGQIFYFRPAGYTVSSLFIVVFSLILGRLWSWLLPDASRGKVWDFLNPCAFNIKEHTCILIMSSTGFSSAMAISAFAAEELYYDTNPNYGVAIFTMIGSQFFGYGLVGLCRSFAVFPTYVVYPSLVPTVQLFDVLHHDTDVSAQKKCFRFFAIVFVAIFCWEFFPEFIAPTLTGVSIFCLARQDSAWVSHIFGGSYPNEGFGMFSLCFDWSYIQGMGSLYTPLQTTLTLFVGVGISIVVTAVCYVRNVWQAQNFPWMAQDLYYENGSLYNQTLVLDANYNLNTTALAEQGVPWYTMSMMLYYLGCNLAIGSTLMHGILWYGPAMLAAIRTFRARHGADRCTGLDPHYLKMLAYKEVPMYVYGGIVVGSFAMAMATCYTGHAQLPWYLWAGITGWQVDTSSLILMLGAAVVPGNARANMYFTLYGAQAAYQGVSMAQDLKLAQYTKVPPRTTLFVQSLGTVVAGMGTTSGLGQQVQSFNAQAYTWGALAKHMYAPGTTYAILPWMVLIGLAVPVPFWLVHKFFPKLRLNLVLTPLLCYTLGELNSGINSQWFISFTITLASQWYAHKYRATWFRRYNYILSAALDAGTITFVFIATFALFSGTGNTVTMPVWGLNPAGRYPDCMSALSNLPMFKPFSPFTSPRHGLTDGTSPLQTALSSKWAATLLRIDAGMVWWTE